MVPFEGNNAVPFGRVLFSFVDISVPCLKVQSTNDGYNILLRSIDVSMKVIESVMVNCKEIFARARASGISALFSAAAFLPKVEFTILTDSPDTNSPTSSDRLSDTASLRPNSAENILSSFAPPTRGGGGGGFPPMETFLNLNDSSASLRDDFGEFLPRDLDVETMSLRSVLSESSMVDMSGALGMPDDFAATLSMTGQTTDDTSSLAPSSGVLPNGPNWSSQSPAWSERSVVCQLSIQSFHSFQSFHSVFILVPLLFDRLGSSTYGGHYQCGSSVRYVDGESLYETHLRRFDAAVAQ